MSFAFSAGVSLRPARHSASPMYEANHRSLRLAGIRRCIGQVQPHVHAIASGTLEAATAEAMELPSGTYL